MAAASGVMVGNLLAAVTTPATAPMAVVGSQIIDWTPTPAKEWAVAALGTADKPILLAAIAAGILAVAVLAGWLAQGQAALGALVFTAFGVVASAIAVTRPAAGLSDAGPSIVATLTAVGTLAASGRASRPRGDTGPSRRWVLTQAAVLTAALAAQASASVVLRRRTTSAETTLPRATDALPPLPQGVPLDGITAFRTPNRDFYRVDTRLTLPVIDLESWRLRIDGDVRRPVSLTYDDLAAMRVVERDITLTCVSNDVGGRYVGGARWLGVRLSDVLDLAGVEETSADQILSTDVDGMTISTPLDVATDGRDSLIAIGMNGQPLPRAHGFPARLIVPGLYGFVGATKWITRMTLTTYAEQDAYWTQRGWATSAPIKPSSRIDTPRPFTDVRAGEVVVGGIAWAQQRGGVAVVELSIDDGPWQPTTLGPSAGPDYWRQWHTSWRATAGRHTLTVREVSGDGGRQSSRRANPFPDGSTGLHRLVVNVT